MSEQLPEERVVIDAPVRSLIDWELDKTKKAQLEADLGNLRLAADLCESLMEDDGRIRGAFNQRTAVLRLPQSFTPGKGPRAAQALKDLDPTQGGDHDELFEPSELEKIHKWGLMLGVCPFRMNWWENGKARIRNGRNVPSLSWWHPRDLRFDWMLREWRLLVNNGQELTITEDGDEFALYMPYGSVRPWAHGLYRALKLFWISGLLSFEDYNRYNEKLGIGAFAATPPVGTKEDDPAIKRIARELKNLGRDKAFALPAGWLLELIESKSTSAEAFRELISICDKGKAITILGQNLTTEVDKNGSRAAASTHKSISDEIIGFDARVIQTQKRKVIRPWAKFNYGSVESAPSAVIDVTPPEDDSARVSTWKTLGEAAEKLIDDGFNPDLDLMAQLVKLPQKGPAKAREKRIDKPAQVPGSAARGLGKLTGPQKPETAFARGRAYVDNLEVSCCEHMAREFSPLVAATLAAVEESTGYVDLQEKLRAIYKDELPPSKLMKITEGALIMAQMAGKETVEQELSTEE